MPVPEVMKLLASLVETFRTWYDLSDEELGLAMDEVLA